MRNLLYTVDEVLPPEAEMGKLGEPQSGLTWIKGFCEGKAIYQPLSGNDSTTFSLLLLASLPLSLHSCQD